MDDDSQAVVSGASLILNRVAGHLKSHEVALAMGTVIMVGPTSTKESHTLVFPRATVDEASDKVPSSWQGEDTVWRAARRTRVSTDVEVPQPTAFNRILLQRPNAVPLRGRMLSSAVRPLTESAVGGGNSVLPDENALRACRNIRDFEA